MKDANRLSSVSYADAAASSRDREVCVVLLVTADAAFSHRLMRALNGSDELSHPDVARTYQFPIATSFLQARSCIGRAEPAIILLDESIGAPNLFTHVLPDLARTAPIVLLAAPESLTRWCALAGSSALVAHGRVECIPKQGDCAPLAARLIERHANRRLESAQRNADDSMTPSATGRVQLDSVDAPLDFGEVLRHEVNNPLTGILGNAELLLSRRDRISGDMVERLEIIADLAIRLRETVRRLSNSLERRSARVPAHAPTELVAFHRSRPLT